MAYRYEATTIAGFVQQLAVGYVARGYWFYVTGHVPESKDPATVDAKLITKYRVDVSKWTRARRKRGGQANVHYLRYGRFFVLVATHGAHEFFVEEAMSIRDARKAPIKFGGYAIAYRGGHASVRIEREAFKDLKAYFLEVATRRSVRRLVGEFWRLPFEPYAPVKRQLFELLRAVNRARKTAGYELVPSSCIRLRRAPCRPFEVPVSAEHLHLGPSSLPGSFL